MKFQRALTKSKQILCGIFLFTLIFVSFQNSGSPQNLKYIGYYWAHSDHLGHYMNEVTPYTNVMFMGTGGSNLLSDSIKAKSKGMKVIINTTDCLINDDRVFVNGVYVSGSIHAKSDAQRALIWNTPNCKPLYKELMEKSDVFAFYLLDEAYSHLVKHHYFKDQSEEKNQSHVEGAFLASKSDLEEMIRFLKSELPPGAKFLMTSGPAKYRYSYGFDFDYRFGEDFDQPPAGVDYYSLSCYDYSTDGSDRDYWYRFCEDKYNKLANIFNGEILMTVDSYNHHPASGVAPSRDQQTKWAAIAKRLPKNVGILWFLYASPSQILDGITPGGGARSFPDAINYHQELGREISCAQAIQASADRRSVCGNNNVLYINADAAKCAGVDFSYVEGHLDGLDAEGNIIGWVYDQDVGAHPVKVHVFIDGPGVGSAKWGIEVLANQPRLGGVVQFIDHYLEKI
ncbi:MAG: hypothetical protein SGI74_02805 [Oligoflexia bacterium]|nr:hypothetical protein [Oligoflexia bacterium]